MIDSYVFAGRAFFSREGAGWDDPRWKRTPQVMRLPYEIYGVEWSNQLGVPSVCGARMLDRSEVVDLKDLHW